MRNVVVVDAVTWCCEDRGNDRTKKSSQAGGKWQKINDEPFLQPSQHPYRTYHDEATHIP
jgi:hypothetical protein